MNRNGLIGLGLLLGVAGTATFFATIDGTDTLDAAPGDIIPTTPREDTGLVLERICIEPGHVLFRFQDSLGGVREVVARNGKTVGFNYTDGAPISVDTPTLFTDVRSALTLTGTKTKAAVDAVRTAGGIVVTGTTQ